MHTNLNRFLAASDALSTLDANRSAGLPVNLEQLLDAQRRVSESQSRYFQSLAEYTLAAKNVQFEKGTLLETTNLFIAGDASANFAVPAIPVDSETDPARNDSDDSDSVSDAEEIPVPVPDES